LSGPIDRRLVVLFAIACGASLANLYYAQPLLPAIGAQFGVSDGTAALCVTFAQIAYSIGLVLIVPLGDLLERWRLIPLLLGACALALAGAAIAPSFAVLVAALTVAAFSTVVVQILLPFAGTLARDRERGHVVGLVMSGTLIGALSARTFSGLLAAAAGWRLPFAVAAAISATLAVVLFLVLPRTRPPASLGYRSLILSVGTLIRREPALRRRMAYGACGFAGFSLAWTTLAFVLAAPPHELGEGAIGLFGLAGIAGAFGARRLGRLHDRGRGLAATGWVLAAVLLSWGLLDLGERYLPMMALGLVFLDFGVQGQNVLSQGVIYNLGTESASRVTTAYVTANFLGGALGSAAGSAAWNRGGWSAVCAVGAGLAALALGLWLIELRSADRRST
jgi:predicted MFS family arabinose efflux permease